MTNTIHLISDKIKFTIVQPIIKTTSSKKELKKLTKKIVAPLLSIIIFLSVWQLGHLALYNKEAKYKIATAQKEQGAEAAKILEQKMLSGDKDSQPNTLPSPENVWNAFEKLVEDHQKISADKEAFLLKTEKINEVRIANGENPIVYTGRPSFVDQIFTSLKTVFTGFLLAMFIAIPAGIVLGLNKTMRTSVNWIIQILKPVSPVVWLLLVFMIVKTLTKDSTGDSAFLISFISVGLCSMWATLVNTIMGVSSVNKDYINVAKVLKLSHTQKIFKVILPASIPAIFTGLRITLSVAWMVLIAIELLAQSPGLGSFVWEEFQNGANDSNSKIIAAMFVIGLIGFVLDRIMLNIQKFISFEKQAI